MSRAEMLARRRRMNKEELDAKFGRRSSESPSTPAAEEGSDTGEQVTPQSSAGAGTPLAATTSPAPAAAPGTPAAAPAGASPAAADDAPEVRPQTYAGSGTPVTRAPSMGIGVAHEQGRRPTMEDAHALHAQLPGAPTGTSFFVVADGHAGRSVADMVAELLPRDIAARLNAGSDPAAALPASFVAVDRKIFSKVGVADGGAAAVAALLRGPELWVAHIGDCRAVVCDAGKAVVMTRDHRASDPQEKKRVESEGAFVAFGRVCASLMVTRTFGDFGFKGGDTMATGRAKPVSNIPELARFVLTSSTEFLLLACDGVFDVMDNDQAVALCRQHIRDGPQRMAQELVKASLAKGTMDNVTAAVITFSRPAG
eukprot:TRINITY_DN12610_c0_g1_i1.p1 TRINITY_DN12610_c0_g1~~TRINITY_DN12610_c0_g1_i1.p1  ORF type:complete len:406 (+),score=114.91 TRINITY_DN12610_c0_g1_i1:114-1220(+)